MNSDDLLITLLFGMLAVLPAYMGSKGMQKWFAERQPTKRVPRAANTARVLQAPERWPEVLKLVAAGEEVQVTHRDKVIAKLVPANVSPSDGQHSSRSKEGHQTRAVELSPC